MLGDHLINFEGIQRPKKIKSFINGAKNNDKNSKNLS